MRRLSEVLRAVLSYDRCKPLIVLGDSILDRYITGDSERISREAPIPILRHQKEHVSPGGAANVACNIAASGHPVVLISVTGTDQEAGLLEGVLDYPGLTLELTLDPLRPTTVKTRLLSQAQQMFRFDKQDVSPIDTKVEDALLSRVKALLPQSCGLILSDYGNGVLSKRVLQESIQAARQEQVFSIVDPRRRDMRPYHGASYITPNREELEAVAGEKIDDDTSVETCAQRLLEECQLDGVLSTRGAKGLSLISKDQAQHFPAHVHRVFDVTGAGDCVVAWFAIALACKAQPNEAANLANHAGGLAVKELGATILTQRDMLRLLDEPVQGHSYKIFSMDALARQVEIWRKKSLRLGFTNGCFDLLHVGHVTQLRFARARCDRLIVGLNSDVSVRNLKGRGRPLQAEQWRSQVIAALQDVDAVCLFDGNDANELIKVIRPDSYIKGSDYDLDHLQEAKLVRALGGTCSSAPLVEGVSTSLVWEKIK